MFNNIPYLEYIFFPVLGAIIGFVTNSIAIKMLFKPHNEWRLWGLRVPFTPGIIPKKRDELARNIGEMVGTILLNEETLKNQLLSTRSQDILKKIIYKHINELLDYEAPTLYEMVPLLLRDLFDSYYIEIKKGIQNSFSEFVYSDSFNTMIHTIVKSRVHELSDKTLDELFPHEEVDKFFNIFIRKVIASFLQNSFFKEWIENKIDDLALSPMKLNEIFPERAVTLISEKIMEEVPDLMARFEMGVYISDIDSKLFITLKEALFSYLEELNTVQKLMVNVIGVEKRIEEDLPHIIRQNIVEVFKKIDTVETRELIGDNLNQSINRLLQNTLGKLIKNLKKSEYDAAKESIINGVHQYLISEDQYKKLSSAVYNLYKNGEVLKINKIYQITDYTEDSISNTITDFIVSLLQQETIFTSFISFIEKEMDDFVFHKSIGCSGKFISINEDHKERLSHFFSQELQAFLEKEISYVVEAINVQQVVITKINLFPIEEVEGLVFIIIKKHLKWINIFGAILGFIIGSIKLAF